MTNKNNKKVSKSNKQMTGNNEIKVAKGITKRYGKYSIRKMVDGVKQRYTFTYLKDARNFYKSINS